MKCLLIIGSLLALAIFLRPTPSHAQQLGCCVIAPGNCANNSTQLECSGSDGINFYANKPCSDPTVTECQGSPAATPAPTPAATASTTTVELPNPIACNDATCLIGQVVRYILGTIAVIATLMFVWGGVMMLTSGGNADQVKRAKETLVWAAIGVVVILLSWVIIKAVLQALTKTSS